MKELTNTVLKNGDVIVLESWLSDSLRYYVVLENIFDKALLAICIKDSKSADHAGWINLDDYCCSLPNNTAAVYRPRFRDYVLSTDYLNSKCFEKLDLRFKK